ncbi:MAG TPA: hypothetical protein GX529_09345 [Firmicutes bacterium]|nr:hypothetical protein [Candidatus Fermentithermobacillaceae bacterium]
MEQFGNIVSSICILMAWSYLIKENPLYTFAEHLLVGMAVGRGIAYTIEVQLKPRIVDGIVGEGRWSLLIPAVIGCLIYFRFFKGYEWVSRICMAVWIGYGAGNFLGFNPATYMPQIFDTFIRLDSFDNVLYFVIVVLVIWYFIFTIRKESGPLKHASMLGRYALMVAFGSAYGSITMAYLSLIIGQLQIILRDTLHLIK